MDSYEQEKLQIASIPNPYLLRLKCFLCQEPNPNVNDENNNLKETNSNKDENTFNPISKLPLYTCPDCEAKIRIEGRESGNSSTITLRELDKEADQSTVFSETSSDEDEDGCWCHVCSSNMNDENDTRYKKLWDHLSHVIKCLYRATDQDFSENHLSNDISKAKRYVRKLTKVNPRLLFIKLETIVLEYVQEIRKHVLERFHSCSKTSHDVQLFISFLLDEYQMFIQAANTVSSIVFYLEERYMKIFNLNWSLYNKHLYNDFIYMDRKIHHSMTTMVDLLQPNTEDETENNTDNDYSPTQYTQLLNRFLTFDVEMSEVTCLYKDCQTKMLLKSNIEIKSDDRSTSNLTKGKICKKQNRKNSSKLNNNENPKSSTTTAVDIPSSKDFLSKQAAALSEQGSNSSSVGSATGVDEFSSNSSMDDQILDNDTSSSGYTQEEQEELTQLMLNDDMNEYLIQEFLNTVAPYSRSQSNLESTTSNDKQRRNDQNTVDIDDDWIREIIFGEIMRPRRTSRQKSTDNSTETKINNDKTAQTKERSDSSSKKTSSMKCKSTKSSTSSRRRKETSSSINVTTASNLNCRTPNSTQIPRKSIDADFILPKSLADLTAKIQSVSFTAGTFGSIAPSNSNDYLQSPSTLSPSNSSTTTKSTTSMGQTRLSINLTRKSGFKSSDHGGQKIAEALLNEFTSLANNESSIRETLGTLRKKDNQQFKKSKQQRSNPINCFSSSNDFLTSSNNPSNVQSSFGSNNKPDSNSSSSSAYNNLDQLLRHAASPGDLSEATLNSILSSFHATSTTDSTSSLSMKSSISSKTTEALQALIAQQQQQHHHHHLHHTKKSNLNNQKRCEFCCCEFTESRTGSPSNSFHLPSTSTTNNGNMVNCVTCMSLPAGSTTTTSVMGTTIAGAFNQRDIEMKERLKLKLTKRTVQNLAEQQSVIVDQKEAKQQTSKKQSSTVNNKSTNKKTNKESNVKMKNININDKNDIDDLVRYIDGDTNSSGNNDHHSTSHENHSKKNKKKKDKQAKLNSIQTENTNQSTQNKQSESPSKTSKDDDNIDKHDSHQSLLQTEKNSRNPSPLSQSKQLTTNENPIVIEQSEKKNPKRKQTAKLKKQQNQKKTMEKLDPTRSISATSSITSNSSVNTTFGLPTPSPSESSQTILNHSSISDQRSEVFDSPEEEKEEEEEVNWIKISRKQTKQKTATTTVPSLLATPVHPVSTVHNTKTNRQNHSNQQAGTNIKKTANSTNVPQQKTTSSNTPLQNLNANSSMVINTVKHTSNTTSVQSRTPSSHHNLMSNSILKRDSSVHSPSTVKPAANLWKTNSVQDNNSVKSSSNHPHNSVTSSNVLPTNSSFTCTNNNSPSMMFNQSSNLTSAPIITTNSMLKDDRNITSVWDSSSTYLPSASSYGIATPILSTSTSPGPVQRPNLTFSPAPGTMNTTTSRCIQRPSPDARSTPINESSFPLYCPMSYLGNGNTSGWIDSIPTNSSQLPWNSVDDELSRNCFTDSSNDFPLYDPFHSGTGLTIPSVPSINQMPSLISGFPEHFGDFCSIPQNDDSNLLDGLNKQLTDLKFCFEHAPLENCDKVKVNVSHCFLRQGDH